MSRRTSRLRSRRDDPERDDSPTESPRDAVAEPEAAGSPDEPAEPDDPSGVEPDGPDGTDAQPPADVAPTDEQADAIPSPPERTDDTAAHGPSLMRLAGTARSPRLAWGVALVSLAVALVSLTWVGVLTAPERRADDATVRAEEIAEHVTTFRGEDIDQWVADTRALATGAYADQVESLFDEDFREALRDNEVESEGNVERAFLQRIEDDVAEVFVLAHQESTNVLRDQPVADQLRMEIVLHREDGEWRASDIAVLGPSPVGPGDPDLETLPDGDPDDADADEGADDAGDGDE